MSQLWRTIKSSISALRYSEDQAGKAFLIAADTGDLDKMLEHIGCRGVSYQDEYGQRPLHRASRRGHAAAVRMLLEYGSDPNACDHVGAYTAIQYAAHYQHAEVVRLLVSYGADVYYQNRIACRPATYYAHKYPLVRIAIQMGTSDLYIHRSIGASFLIQHCFFFKTHFESLSLKHSIAMIIIQFLPRHQLWTQCKTRYITNNTTNWHSSDLFSEKHREKERKNKIHSCQYHGEFDIDKDWEKIKELTLFHHDNDSDDDDDEYYTTTDNDDDDDDDDHEIYHNSYNEEEEENKYHQQHDNDDNDDDDDDNYYYSNTSHSRSPTSISYTSYSSSSNSNISRYGHHKSLSDDDVGSTDNDIIQKTTIKNRKRERRKRRKRERRRRKRKKRRNRSYHNNYNHQNHIINNNHNHNHNAYNNNNNGQILFTNNYLQIGLRLFLFFSILITAIIIHHISPNNYYYLNHQTLNEIMIEIWNYIQYILYEYNFW